MTITQSPYNQKDFDKYENKFCCIRCHSTMSLLSPMHKRHEDLCSARNEEELKYAKYSSRDSDFWQKYYFKQMKMTNKRTKEQIARKMKTQKENEEMMETGLILGDKWYFGVHQGKIITELPTEYLIQFIKETRKNITPQTMRAVYELQNRKVNVQL